jgi:hypothetical protein
MPVLASQSFSDAEIVPHIVMCLLEGWPSASRSDVPRPIEDLVLQIHSRYELAWSLCGVMSTVTRVEMAAICAKAASSLAWLSLGVVHAPRHRIKPSGAVALLHIN